MPGTAAAAPTAAARRSQYVFLAGAISGIAEGISVQPLEMLKTRFQIHTGEHLRVLPTIKEIIREGGVRQLYRGGLPEISGLVPRATAALSTLEFSRRLVMTAHNGRLPTAHAYATGALCGVTEAIAFSPFQVIKVRLMAKEHLGKYANTWDCLAKVLRQEGPRALLIGLTPTLWRNCIWNGIFYGTMHELEAHVLQPLGSRAAESARSVAVGTGVGVVATVFVSPFDVVKSRFQSQLPENRRYRHTIPTLLTIAREEGPLALYRGFLPKAVRLGVGQSIGLVAFTNLLHLFGAAK